MSLVDLCQRCNACALKVYLAVAGMLQAGLFALVPTEEADPVKAATAAGNSSSVKTIQASSKPRETLSPKNLGVIGAQKIPSVSDGPLEMKDAPSLVTASREQSQHGPDGRRADWRRFWRGR